MSEQLQRRRSFFEKTNKTIQEEETTKTLLEEWDKIFGKYHPKDYVNVVKYPEEYAQKIKEERELWLEGLDDLNKKIEILFKESKCDFIINEDILSADQVASLRAIDSRINQFMEKATTFLKDFTVYKRMLEVKLEKIEREAKMVEQLAVTKK